LDLIGYNCGLIDNFILNWDFERLFW
jgi:hypothetical protein